MINDGIPLYFIKITPAFSTCDTQKLSTWPTGTNKAQKISRKPTSKKDFYQIRFVISLPAHKPFKTSSGTMTKSD